MFTACKHVFAHFASLSSPSIWNRSLVHTHARLKKRLNEDLSELCNKYSSNRKFLLHFVLLQS